MPENTFPSTVRAWIMACKLHIVLKTDNNDIKGRYSRRGRHQCPRLGANICPSSYVSSYLRLNGRCDRARILSLLYDGISAALPRPPYTLFKPIYPSTPGAETLGLYPSSSLPLHRTQSLPLEGTTLPSLLDIRTHLPLSRWDLPDLHRPRYLLQTVIAALSTICRALGSSSTSFRWFQSRIRL